MMLTQQKEAFKLRPHSHYLNCAYKGPLLKSCEAAAITALIKDRNPSDRGVDDFFETIKHVKNQFGKIINASADQIAILPSSSYGFASVLNNLTAHPNQEAITISDEFPSAYLSLEKWCKKHQAKLKVITPDNGLESIGENWNQKILDQINSNTNLVLLSSVHWMNGIKFDLKAIGEKCKSVGATFIVDGTQSVGALPIDIEAFGIDALICAAYKWLFCPYGTALAYFGPKFNNGDPIEESWMNRTNASDFANLTQYSSQYKSGATRYNVGQTSNFILLPMVEAALTQINAWTPEAIQNYCKTLIAPLKTYLANAGVILESDAYTANHLYALKLPSDTNTTLLKEKLEANAIFVSLRGHHIRVSFNVFNTESDINALINCIESART